LCCLKFVSQILRLHFVSRLCCNHTTEHIFSLLSQQNYKIRSLTGVIEPFLQTSDKISAADLQYHDSHATYHPPSLVIKPPTPIILIILVILKQLDNTDASALTPSRPRKRKLPTFKLCLIWPNGSSTFCLRSL
jgi:hypothetical protein